MQEQNLEEVVIKRRVKIPKELEEEYRNEFEEKYPFNPNEVNKEDYIKMREDYVDKRYHEECDAWQDKTPDWLVVK